MKILFEDLKRNIKEDISVEQISESLFQLGHENEISSDKLDIDITPNRGDCLSLKGILNELNCFYTINNNSTNHNYNELGNLELDFKNKSTDDCPEISFMSIEVSDFEEKYSPEIERFFKKLDIKKNNFFTDISNYLIYEMGLPTHCYDLDKINGCLTLEKNIRERSFLTLANKEIKVSKDDLVFTMNDEIINLAGIIGGKSTSCSTTTKKVLIECAFFNPETIIGKSIKYDLKTDASFRFERGVDRAIQEKVLRRFLEIVNNHSNIIEAKFVNFSHKDFKKREIEANIKKINKILDLDISEDKFKEILNNLGFKVSNKITIPSFRQDISNQNDIAEEVARVIGFDNIPRKSFKFQTLPSNNKKVALDQKIRTYLTNLGFFECINNPFSAEELSTSIFVDNPLDSSKRFLRCSSKNSLVQNLVFNQRRQKETIKLFEISDFYSKEGNNISSKRKLGIICSGRVDKTFPYFNQKIDKNFLMNIFSPLDNSHKLSVEEIPYEKIKSKKKEKIFYSEIELSKIEKLMENISEQSLFFRDGLKYKKISEFPSTSRDISFLINDFSLIDDLKSKIMSINIDILKESLMFDYFKKENEVKIGYRFVFQSNSRTLEDEEVDKVIDGIVKSLSISDKIYVPGYKS
jgi:phenylalanyl-tRNA synthetase beta chain